MPTRSRLKRLEKLTQPQYALLQDVTDQGAIDAAGLLALVGDFVGQRLALSDALMEAAHVLRAHENLLVRCSAVSRAYYAAYQAARATVFLVHRRDEDAHKNLPGEITRLVNAQAGEVLKELSRLRNEFDYSPYPGPNSEERYDDEEIDGVVQDTVEQARFFIEQLTAFRNARG
jgi:uncharacterized protein (UPF0332 family)